MVFVMTKDSVQPLSVCKDEWVRALRYKKPIIPLLVYREAELPIPPKTAIHRTSVMSLGLRILHPGGPNRRVLISTIFTISKIIAKVIMHFECIELRCTSKSGGYGTGFCRKPGAVLGLYPQASMPKLLATVKPLNLEVALAVQRELEIRLDRSIVGFTRASQVKEPYEVVGIISYDNPGKYQVLSLGDAIEPLKTKAREIGANGIIIDKSQPVKSGLISTGIYVEARAIRIKNRN
jgi:hypothetical protein